MKRSLTFTTTTIPAHPGFDRALLIGDAFQYIPIIAWVVEVCGDAPDADAYSYAGSMITPLCIDENMNDEHNVGKPIIRDPAGRIHFSDGIQYSKGEEKKALAEAKRREAARRRPLEVV